VRGVRNSNLSAATRFGGWALASLLVFSGGSAAVAHGILKSAEPGPDSRASSPPRVVTTTLTEDPLPGGRYIVRDGCGLVVSKTFSVDGPTISARTPDGQPGKWNVRFDFISSSDGHRYNQTYSFSVAGKKDCSAPEEPEGHKHEGKENGNSASSSHPSGTSHGEVGGSARTRGSGPQVPSLPLALASAAAIGLALFGRRSAATT
jgi:methionine-rich copper-binding protein CopC